MKCVLFVDDEPNVLQGLQRMLRPLRSDWEMVFAAGVGEALAALDARSFDVVISDMRMPELNGAQLLAEVMERQPRAVRIILSGQSEQQSILKAVGPTHQYLSKPCESDTLRRVIAEACRLRDLLPSEGLQRLVSRITVLPSKPELYRALRESLEAAGVSQTDVADIVRADIAMTARVLQLTNSAFFGAFREVSDPVTAVSLLGMERLKALLDKSPIFVPFETTAGTRFHMSELWEHSHRVRRIAACIAELEGLGPDACAMASTAGLLHDIGRLALAAFAPEEYETVLEEVEREDASLVRAERAALGACHAEVGAYLLGLWGLPAPIVDAVAYHHCPRRCGSETLTLAAILQMAEALEQTILDDAPPVDGPMLDAELVESLGIAPRLPAWLRACADLGLEHADSPLLKESSGGRNGSSNPVCG